MGNEVDEVEQRDLGAWNVPDDLVSLGDREDAMGFGRLAPVLLIVAVAAGAAGLVLRFQTRSAMWLDEALSVEIASLPLGEIPSALRNDGHPPLFYVLLKGWMELFGGGDGAVRAFSGAWGVALIALLWVAGRRLGGTRVAALAVATVILNPYAIRYATEARMYSMVAVLAIAWILLAQDVLGGRGTRVRSAGLVLLTSALCWTHYWAFWFLATAAVALLISAWRRSRRDDPRWRREAGILTSMVSGGVLFLPWLPSLLHQSSSTGTPWARPMRPAEIVAATAADFGGGPQGEAVVLGWLLIALCILGTFGIATGRAEITLDLRTRPVARPLAILVAGTLAVGWLTGFVSGSTFTGRYASVIFPAVVLLAALGLSCLRSGPVLASTVVLLVLLGSAGSIRNLVTERTDARRTVAAIEEVGASGDLVILCPDQLGPSTSRLLDDGFDPVTYPDMAPPQLVDWTDYQERLDDADPVAFIDAAVARAGSSAIFLVYSPTYETHGEICPALVAELAKHRPGLHEISTLGDAYEPSAVVVAPAA